MNDKEDSGVPERFSICHTGDGMGGEEGPGSSSHETKQDKTKRIR